MKINSSKETRKQSLESALEQGTEIQRLRITGQPVRGEWQRDRKKISTRQLMIGMGMGSGEAVHTESKYTE